VLLLDRHEFPRDKVCGDALPARVIDILGEAGIKDKLDEALSRGDFHPLTRMRLVSPKGYHGIYPLHKSENGSSPLIAPRFFFDPIIRQHAVDSGAEFRRLKVERPLQENERVAGVTVLNDGTLENIRSSVTVGADGANSVIARVLRSKAFHVDAHRAIALRAYIEGIEIYPHEAEFYLHRSILPGYAWLFPLKEGLANIGLGMRLDYYRRTPCKLKKMLEEFLAMPVINKRLSRDWKLRDIAAWPLNFGSQKNLQYAFAGALLVGDAAGFINPLTGGGIQRSLLSAELAARTVQEALQGNDTSRTGLLQYEKRCKELLLGSLRLSYHLQKVLFRFPSLLDFLVRRLPAESKLARAIIGKL